MCGQDIRRFAGKLLDSAEFRENRFAFEPDLPRKLPGQSWRVSEDLEDLSARFIMEVCAYSRLTGAH